MRAYLAVMMHRLRKYAAIILASAIALTGNSAAAIQTARDATGQIVICTGTGPATIFVDNNGQPTAPPHICPDCMMHLLDSVEAPDTSVFLLDGVNAPSFGFGSTFLLADQECVGASARGPPVRALLNQL